MQRGELAKARRLLRKLDRLREQFDLDEALPKPARKDTSTHEAQKGNLGGDGVLAAEVWERGACRGLPWPRRLAAFVVEIC